MTKKNDNLVSGDFSDWTAAYTESSKAEAYRIPYKESYRYRVLVTGLRKVEKSENNRDHVGWAWSFVSVGSTDPNLLDGANCSWFDKLNFDYKNQEQKAQSQMFSHLAAVKGRSPDEYLEDSSLIPEDLNSLVVATADEALADQEIIVDVETVTEHYVNKKGDARYKSKCTFAVTNDDPAWLAVPGADAAE